MPEQPSGAVTFLFTDIEGSTRLVKQLRDRYPGVLAEHQRLLRAAFDAHGGYEVDTQGDSFFVAFASAREAVLATVIGLPLLAVLLWITRSMGEMWWLWVWVFWLGFNVLVMLVWPTFIAPLFNKFTPLADAALKARVEALLARCGFQSKGLFVMDGSRRSAHGNAYFTGFGAAKRIVFFDTLLDKLAPQEVEAVLAHELGHFHHRHVLKRIAVMGAGSLAVLALLGMLIEQPWFYAGLGVSGTGTAMALALFSLALPAFTFPFAPLMSYWSRAHEFEADRYAARQTRAGDLVSALVKLYRDNAATLTPDPKLRVTNAPKASSRVVPTMVGTT